MSCILIYNHCIYSLLQTGGHWKQDLGPFDRVQALFMWGKSYMKLGERQHLKESTAPTKLCKNK